MWLRRKSQSILEYAILIAIVVAAILIMQTFMKRGVQGRLKDSSEKIGGGTSYSASGTTILEDRQMKTPRAITEMTSTDANTGDMAVNMGLADKGLAKADVVDVESHSTYSATTVTGGTTTSKTLTKTADATKEVFKGSDYTSNNVGDFGDLTYQTANQVDWTAPSGQ